MNASSGPEDYRLLRNAHLLVGKWQETRKRFDAFREELLTHEQGEDRLLLEAYNRDLGAND